MQKDHEIFAKATVMRMQHEVRNPNCRRSAKAKRSAPRLIEKFVKQYVKEELTWLV